MELVSQVETPDGPQEQQVMSRYKVPTESVGLNAFQLSLEIMVKSLLDIQAHLLLCYKLLDFV